MLYILKSLDLLVYLADDTMYLAYVHIIHASIFFGFPSVASSFLICYVCFLGLYIQYTICVLVHVYTFLSMPWFCVYVVIVLPCSSVSMPIFF